MMGSRAARALLTLGIAGMALMGSGCGPRQPMQRLGGTLTPVPTETALPGQAAPSSLPGEPGAVQSETEDPASPGLVSGQAGEWPDLLFANLFERPRSSDGTYLPDIDLLGAGLSVEAEWVYVTLRLARPPLPGSGMHYSVEFDTDLDAKPDLLVTAYSGAEPGWGSRGMRVYLDPDKNVGGSRPKLAEPPVAEWDGYEVQREGVTTTVPALVWFRSDPANPNAMQLAVSVWMLGAPEAFAWRAWAEGAVFNPGRQDYNDFHSLEAAGSPYTTSAYYPSRSLVAIDNTCVVAHGFVLAEPLPGYCGTAVGALPAGSPPPDDLVYGERGAGVSLALTGGETVKIPGGILVAPAAP